MERKPSRVGVSRVKSLILSDLSCCGLTLIASAANLCAPSVPPN